MAPMMMVLTGSMGSPVAIGSLARRTAAAFGTLNSAACFGGPCPRATERPAWRASSSCSGVQS
eukprot:3270314-Heterocapsa_arctica.AAC.1